MSIGLLFWIIMIIWLFYGFMYHSSPERFGPYGWAGHGLLLFVLFFLLGWHDFGFIIHR